MRTIRRGFGVAVLAVLAASTVGAAQVHANVGNRGDLEGLSPADVWVGLKNSDDQGTSFDVRVQFFVGSTLASTGVTNCVTGVTRNPSLAKEVVVNWGPVAPLNVFGQTVRLTVSTRIGTNGGDTKCAGHNNAVGLRLYYDADSRKSRYDSTTLDFLPPNFNVYLRSDGNPCMNAESTGVTSLRLDPSAPPVQSPKCKDSGAINFANSNPWTEIDTWSIFVSTPT